MEMECVPQQNKKHLLSLSLQFLKFSFFWSENIVVVKTNVQTLTERLPFGQHALLCKRALSQPCALFMLHERHKKKIDISFMLL